MQTPSCLSCSRTIHSLPVGSLCLVPEKQFRYACFTIHPKNWDFSINVPAPSLQVSQTVQNSDAVPKEFFNLTKFSQSPYPQWGTLVQRFSFATKREERERREKREEAAS